MMLVALYRANPDAFIGNNMNRLKSGQILSVPDADTMRGLDAGEAHGTVVAHAADFNAYRSKLAGQVATSAPARESRRRPECDRPHHRQGRGTPDRRQRSGRPAAPVEGTADEGQRQRCDHDRRGHGSEGKGTGRRPAARQGTREQRQRSGEDRHREERCRCRRRPARGRSGEGAGNGGRGAGRRNAGCASAGGRYGRTCRARGCPENQDRAEGCSGRAWPWRHADG
ncbi:FimV/HubP family polar landmark protein [Massilia sp. Se16.2.3]|uniref:FimV/HubP family polar landmark protein n=1 Tax=Massilia sp. Se16.2.3 TaxID=2709303 RepID=UPI0035A6FF19